MKIFAIALEGLLLSPGTNIGAAAAAPVAVNARVAATDVERSFVGTKSASGYKDQLVRFILYLFDNKKVVWRILISNEWKYTTGRTRETSSEIPPVVVTVVRNSAAISSEVYP